MQSLKSFSEWLSEAIEPQNIIPQKPKMDFNTFNSRVYKILDAFAKIWAEYYVTGEEAFDEDRMQNLHEDIESLINNHLKEPHF